MYLRMAYRRVLWIIHLWGISVRRHSGWRTRSLSTAATTALRSSKVAGFVPKPQLVNLSIVGHPATTTVRSATRGGAVPLIITAVDFRGTN
jgi:hypothetical protein